MSLNSFLHIVSNVSSHTAPKSKNQKSCVTKLDSSFFFCSMPPIFLSLPNIAQFILFSIKCAIAHLFFLDMSTWCHRSQSISGMNEGKMISFQSVCPEQFFWDQNINLLNHSCSQKFNDVSLLLAPVTLDCSMSQSLCNNWSTLIDAAFQFHLIRIMNHGVFSEV